MYQNLLTKIINKRKAERTAIQPPITANSTNNLKKEARARLFYDVPEDYIRFLRITNGFNWNSLFIYASETARIDNTNASIIGFVEANLIWQEYEPHKNLITFGDSSLDKFVYNFKASQYQIVDRVSLEVVGDVSCFDELIANALTSTLN
jgi:hypothetical protein